MGEDASILRFEDQRKKRGRLP